MQAIRNPEHIEILKKLFKVAKYQDYGTLEFTDLFCRLFPATVYPAYANPATIEQDITVLLYSQD